MEALDNNQTTIKNQTIMTVKELSAILNTVDNSERIVYMDCYSISETNGYYYSKREDKNALILTTLHVQPLISENK